MYVSHLVYSIGDMSSLLADSTPVPALAHKISSEFFGFPLQHEMPFHRSCDYGSKALAIPNKAIVIKGKDNT